MHDKHALILSGRYALSGSVRVSDHLSLVTCTNLVVGEVNHSPSRLDTCRLYSLRRVSLLKRSPTSCPSVKDGAAGRVAAGRGAPDPRAALLCVVVRPAHVSPPRFAPQAASNASHQLLTRLTSFVMMASLHV